MFTLTKYRSLLIFLLCALSFLPAAAQVVKGRVLDASNGDPLPMVNIVYDQANKKGVATDVNGYFTIPNKREIVEIQVSFIGYQNARFSKLDIPLGGTWTILLKPSNETLNQIDVQAGENPALRIVRNCIDNKDINDPKRMKSYYYRSYNKNVLTYDLSTDSLATAQDSAKWLKDVENSKTNHLLVIESVTKKYFKAPNHQKEVVVGTKISGFKEPNFGMIPNDIAHFGFYDNTIKLTNKTFLNPVADGADDNYAYLLKDTIFGNNGDTTFIMDYFPRPGANFEGFTGVLHINSHHWAIEYVTAEPYDRGKIYLFIEQKYELQPNDVWFPRQLNFELTLEKVPFRKQGAVMKGKTFLDSIEIGMEIPDEVFTLMEVELDKKAAKVTDDFWEQNRKEALSVKEVATYDKMDKVGEKYAFDFLLKSSRHAYKGFIALGPINVEAKKLFAYNDYEGLRLGAGLYTNEEVSEFWSIGGYFGYGFSDKAWKYGGKLELTLDRENEVKWFVEYQNDVINPGAINLYYWRRANFATQFFNTNMDLYERRSTSLDFRFYKYSQFRIGFGQHIHKTTYNYQFTPIDADPDNSQTYITTEARFNWRFLYKERLTNNFGQRISMGSKYPVINVTYAHGFKGMWEGQFNYNKIELGVQWDHYTPQLGRTIITFEAGLIDQPVPYSLAFGGRPSYNPSFSVFVKNTFQTMRFNEFASDQYASLFFLHDFGPLLLRSGWFKPEIRYVQGISFGSLQNPEFHQTLNLKTLEEGFFESGIIVDNLIRINVLNTGYFGVGAGAFYRYGANHLPNPMDNWTFKFAFMYSVN